MKSLTFFIFGSSFLLVIMAFRPCQADSSDSNQDGSDETYYWQGNQLNNMSRLSNASADFEEVQRRARLNRGSNQYLAGIRQQMSHQATTDAEKKNLLTLQGQLPSDPLQVVYTEAGIEATLHADMIFSQDSTAVKIGAVDILDRLRGLLQNANQKPVHLVISDRLDDSPEAREVDAERSLMILALVEFPQQGGAQQENLSPEPLASQ